MKQIKLGAGTDTLKDIAVNSTDFSDIANKTCFETGLSSCELNNLF